MPRDLALDTYEVTLQDNLANDKVTFFYRLPTTIERQQYENLALQNKRNKLTRRIAEARLKYGLKILTGFKEGDFQMHGKPISSDPQSDNHYPEWRSLIEKNAADLVMVLALHVYDASVEVDEENVDGPDDGIIDESPTGNSAET